MVFVADLMLFAADRAAGVCVLPTKGSSPLVMRAWAYVTFNQFVLIPFITSLVLRSVSVAPQIVWKWEDATFTNAVAFAALNFALSDLVYYTNHRIVHTFPFLYKTVHKHHHVFGGSLPERGWVDTANAHPLDFLYTGLSTCPVSTLWLLPHGSVHIAGVIAQLILNGVVGSLGHSRLDIELKVPLPGQYGFHLFRSRFHAGHHALSMCNFAQNIHLWDWLFGTLVWWPTKPATAAKSD
jgi:sterol desaturase/sphingolipid hydroxylase (fatty acid hydroxylase superfamily)